MLQGSTISYTHVLPWLRVCEITLVLPNLSEIFSGYRLLQLSDIHINDGHMTKKRLEQVVAVSNRYKADAAVITGDFVTKWNASSKEGLSPLRLLQSKDPVYRISE